jgi:hypothetical protein
MNGREPGHDTDAALEFRLQLGERDVGHPATRRRRSLSCGASSRRRWPPKCAGAALPVVRTRCISLIAADGLTANRRAAARIELPSSTAPTIRRRRSNDIGAGIIPHPARLNHYCRITGFDSMQWEYALGLNVCYRRDETL